MCNSHSSIDIAFIEVSGLQFQPLYHSRYSVLRDGGLHWAPHSTLSLGIPSRATLARPSMHTACYKTDAHSGLGPAITQANNSDRSIITRGR